MPAGDQVIGLAKLEEAEPNEFLIAFISEKLVYGLQDEEVALNASGGKENKLPHSKEKW